MRRRRASGLRQVAIVLLAATAAAAAGCSPPDGSDDEPASLTVFGPWRGTEADAFRTSMKPFEEQSGIDVVYSGSTSFAAEASRRLSDGETPDVLMFPQPGLMSGLTDQGYLLPLPGGTAERARASHHRGLADAVAETTEDSGLLYTLNVKSLVWYRPAEFAARGYEVPRTWGELDDLAAQILADGNAPWCMGVESFAASGWPATDWVEDIVLRTQPVDVYDAWVAGEIPFTDDAIAQAFSLFADTTLTPGRTVNSRRGILTTPTTTAHVPLFTDPPGCLMHRQASFEADNLDEAIIIGPAGDVDVFVLPAMDDTTTTEPPMLVGGTFAAAATDTPATWALMDFLASSEGSSGWLEAGGVLVPHAQIRPGDYRNEFDARLAQLLADADVVRFDASDQMPPQVGTQSFLAAMLDFIATGRLDDALALAQSGYGE